MDAAIRVLLVDDEKMVRDCLCAYLEDEGYSVYVAATAEEALESLFSINPHVCISDLRLPGMDGETFILKAHTLCPTTGYLLHTGMNYSLSEELLAIGMTADKVMLKPIHDLAMLVSKINSAVTAGRRL